DQTHMEGQLKAEIVANPERFVSLDEDLPLVLRDLKASGKRVILITNSGWNYTQAMMRYVIDPFLPGGQRWRDLFDLVVVAARKPSFFAGNAPFYEVVEEERGLLKPVVGPLVTGGAYVGGHARAIEAHFDLAAEQILYVGDHIFADVKTSKSQLHWRTALIVRELEQELECLERFKPHQASLTEKMEAKELLEHRFSALRLAAQRKEQDYGPQVDSPLEALREAMKAVRLELLELDASISPLVQAASTLHHPRWGLLLRAGNDKSHLARQIERYADMYTSRVSNLLACTPFVYLRSPRGSLPHDSGPGGGV
ncbi:MAG: 5'-nucleotidase domain-containing protein, partial [Myxococcota bacterium]